MESETNEIEHAGSETVDVAPLMRFMLRLSNMGIDTEFISNYPWIYLHKVCGKRVTETYDSEHAFTIAYLPVRADRPFTFIDLGEIFKVIRKYAVPERKVLFEKHVD